MNLHRSLDKPDWKEVPTLRRTSLQHVAAVSFGVLTLGNLISVVGLGLVFFGCGLIIAEHYWLGAIAIIVGRLLDLLDGYVAHRTKTKGPVGEIVDASFDKIGTVAAIFTLFVAEIATWPYLLALFIPQVTITVISIYQKLRRRKIHPTLIGKLSMASLWAAIAGLLLAKGTDLAVLDILAAVLSGAALILGCMASVQYAVNRTK